MAKRKAKPKSMSASEMASRRRQIAGLLYSGLTVQEVREKTGAPKNVVEEEQRLVKKRMDEYEIGPEQKVFSVSQVAGLIGFWTRNVRKAIEDGHLPATRLGREWMIRRTDALKYITALRMRGRPSSRK